MRQFCSGLFLSQIIHHYIMILMILIGIQELSKFSHNVSYTTVTLMPQCATCLNSSCMRLRDLSRQFTLALQMHTHISTHESHMINGIIPLQFILHHSNQSWLNAGRGTEGGKVQDTRWYVVCYQCSSTQKAIIWKSCDEDVLCVCVCVCSCSCILIEIYTLSC